MSQANLWLHFTNMYNKTIFKEIYNKTILVKIMQKN